MARENILIIEDEKLIRWSIRSRLEQEDYRVSEAEDGKSGLSLLQAEKDFDLLLLDFRLPDITGIEILKTAREKWPEISVVMMTAYGTVETAVQAMKLGAFDYLTKPVNLDELALVVRKALETTSLKREVRRLRSVQRDLQGRIRLIGKSPVIAKVQELIAKICASRATTVLLEGDSGTGKNVIAEAIHYGSPRAREPFVNITCSAIAETLLESELFGHERGAFTDAKTQKKGLLEVADGGTAFLDEIGEMGPGMQAKLLRFLEDRTFRRVGGTREIQIDVRVIAATNRNLESAVREGTFREDLFYRLKVIPIRVPTLAERPEDIPLLIQHFLDGFNRDFRKSTNEVDSAALERLMAYAWPGNVRELRNVIERIMILEDKPIIELEDLPSEILNHRAGNPSLAETGGAGGMSLEEMERQAICRALEQSGNNQVRAAKILRITRDTLRYRMKKFGLLDDSRPAEH